jgi:hypothetical protein
MPKEDYLLKFIEKLNRVIAAMIGFQEKGFPEDALRLAEEAYSEMLSIDLPKLGSLSEKEFEYLLADKNINVSYLEYLAEILFQTGEIYEKKQDPVSVTFYKKSLQTLEFLTTKDKTFSFEREIKINTLRTILTKKSEV